MKKLSALMILVLAMLAVAPAFAQDATIADTLLAAAGADPAEYSIFVSAIQTADPDLLDTLANPDANLLVFAPTDAAFGALLEQFGEDAYTNLLSSPETVKKILEYHVVVAPEGSTTHAKMADAASGLESIGGTQSLVAVNGQSVDISTPDGSTITVDGANIVQMDVEASNGTIQGIDAVLLPNLATLADTLTNFATNETLPMLTSLYTALQAADPALLEMLADPEQHLTVFAPTDEAFAALGDDILNGLLNDPEKLTAVLQYHMLPGTIHTYDLISNPDLWSAIQSDENNLDVETLLADQNLTLTKDANGKPLDFLVNGAHLMVKDLDAVNGVIHMIDVVLGYGEH